PFWGLCLSGFLLGLGLGDGRFLLGLGLGGGGCGCLSCGCCGRLGCGDFFTFARNLCRRARLLLGEMFANICPFARVTIAVFLCDPLVSGIEESRSLSNVVGAQHEDDERCNHADDSRDREPLAKQASLSKWQQDNTYQYAENAKKDKKSQSQVHRGAP